MTKWCDKVVRVTTQVKVVTLPLPCFMAVMTICDGQDSKFYIREKQ
nr:MAG TPA: hypothetical protein [Caudoviricetes sp.]